MALGIRAKKNLEELEKRSPVLASAAGMRLQNTGWQRGNFNLDQAWQRQSWYYYRCIPAYHYGANWAADACGRSDIFAADVDERGAIGGPTEDVEVAALVDNLFGGPAARRRMITAIALSLVIAGETWTIGQGGKPGTGRDEWITVAPYEIRPYSGGIWVGEGPYTQQIPDGSALVFPIRKPLAERPWLVDAPGLALLQTLRELEEIYKFKAAQTDSRLANAGIYPLPSGLDFPGDDGTPSGAPALQEAVVQAANASLEGKGSAAQISPIFFEVDKELLQYLFKEPIRFGSVMSDHISKLEEMALQELSVGLCLPPEVVLGTGNSNQWSAWEIGESAVKYHIEPLLGLILDQIQAEYFIAALRKIGKNPKRFVLQADTTALTVSPDRAKDALNLYQVNALSAASLRMYSNFKESDAPTEEETTQRRVQDMLLRDPQLVMDPHIVEASGLDIEVSLPVAGVTPVPPVPDRVAVEGRQPRPARPSAQAMEAPSIIASQVASMARVGRPSPLLTAASVEVHNALRLAGNRLRVPAVRKEFPEVPPHELHTRLRITDDDQAAKLTESAFGGIAAAIEGTGVEPVQMKALLAAYTHSLMRRGVSHNRDLLAAYMADHGLQPWQS